MNTNIAKLKKDDIEYLGKTINDKYHVDKMLGDKDKIAKIIANYRSVGGTVKKRPMDATVKCKYQKIIK